MEESKSSSSNDNNNKDLLTPETQYFLNIKTHTKIKQVPRDAWNGLLRYEDSPFLKHEWLWCMEESGCAIPETGWNPCHLTIWMQKGKDGAVSEEEGEGEIVAAAPWQVKFYFCFYINRKSMPKSRC